MGMKKQMMMLNLRIEDIWKRVKQFESTQKSDLPRSYTAGPRCYTAGSLDQSYLDSGAVSKIAQETNHLEFTSMVKKAREQFERDLAGSAHLLSASLDHWCQQ